MSNLEPDIGMGKGTGRVSENAIKAGEGVFVFALLFVDDAETEEYLVRLVKVKVIVALVHPEHRREGFFGVVERAVPIIENADAVPQLWILLERR
jgi:hypothetical protein